MTALKIDFADRLKKLPPYLFVEIDRAKRKAVSQGRDIIDLGIGDPDLPTPKPIIEALNEAARDPRNHRYALDAGLSEFREAISQWYKRRFGVELNPASEILPLIGSKEGIGHVPLAFINSGDRVLVPEPGYPVYQSGTWFAGGEPLYMSLSEKNHYLPDLSSLRLKDLNKAKMMFINYPNNPTGATASLGFFKQAAEFAQKNHLMVCHDAAYTEVYYEERPHSFLEVPLAKEIGVEFHSLSKTYNMTGWRIGFAVGNAQILQGLGRVKSNLDSGIFQAIQWAGIRALSLPERDRQTLLQTYRERRDALVKGLKEAGWRVDAPKASFYVWAAIPDLSRPAPIGASGPERREGWDSKKLALKLLEEVGIVAAPGIGFGPSGEGYIRFSLTVGVDRIREAVRRLKGAVLV